MEDRAVSSNLAFIVASGIMLASISSIYTATDDLANLSATRVGEQVNLQNEANGLAYQILHTSGLVFDNGETVAWDADAGHADDLFRLGLVLQGSDPELLDFDKLRNLRLSGYDANNTDDEVNYLEVVEDQGYDLRNLGFHVRSKPTLQSVEEILNGGGIKDQTLKVSYLGHVNGTSEGAGGQSGSPGEGLVVGNVTCAVSPVDSKMLRYSLNIENGGSTATQFHTIFTIYTDYQPGDNLDTEPKLDRESQTFLVGVGGNEDAWVDVNHGPGTAAGRADCDGTDWVAVDIWDTTNQLLQHGPETPLGTASPDTAPGEFYAELDDEWVTSGATVTVRYAGSLVEHKDDLTLEVRTTGGSLVHSDAHEAKNNNDQWKFTFNAPANGDYEVFVKHEDNITATQQLLVAPNVDPYTPVGQVGETAYEEGQALRREVTMVDRIMHKFCPFYHDISGLQTLQNGLNLSSEDGSGTWTQRCGGAIPAFKDNVSLGGDQLYGDVYVDTKPSLEELVTQIAWNSGGNWTGRYDYVNMLVVGSDVMHSSLTKGWFKWPLKAWVEGGGTLLVFGSPDKQSSWLQPVFGVKEQGSGSGLSTPDANHPMLNTPDSLAWEDYETFGRGWDPDADDFTEVVKQGDVPVTLISEPGAFQQGTIILTTWLPGVMTDGDYNDRHGMMMMNNFLMQGYKDLFLDYGPAIPSGVPVLPTVEFASVYHPELEETVSLSVAIYVFPYTYG